MGLFGSPELLNYLDHKDNIKCTCGTTFSSNFCPNCGTSANMLKQKPNYTYTPTHHINTYKPNTTYKKTYFIMMLITAVGFSFINPDPISGFFEGIKNYLILILGITLLFNIIQKVFRTNLKNLEEITILNSVIFGYGFLITYIIHILPKK